MFRIVYIECPVQKTAHKFILEVLNIEYTNMFKYDYAKSAR